MKDMGDQHFTTTKSAGGWYATLTCPVIGCGAEASARSASKTGPYNGSCKNGHGIYIRHAEPSL